MDGKQHRLRRETYIRDKKGKFNMAEISSNLSFSEILGSERPQAVAWFQGKNAPSQIGGFAKFYVTSFGGVLVEVEVYGLPDKKGYSNFYALHIHEYGDCRGNFIHTGEHYNPGEVKHPNHAGDMPPLISKNGYAWASFFDGRFSVTDLIGRSIVIHGGADDFTTQPSGNAGEKIACGVIRIVR